MTKAEASEAIQTAMKESGLTFAELDARLKRPRVWLAAAVLGQHRSQGRRRRSWSRC